MLGDSPSAVPQLLAATPRPDYLVMDYLAELTMSFLARAKDRRPEAGYARYFTDSIWPDNMTKIAELGVKVITNAGGLNPQACAARMQETADRAGVQLRIAVVDGDDAKPRLAELQSLADPMADATDWPDPAEVLSANVYLGATPIRAALRAGADVVVTGRVVDSALALGALMHEFDWSPQDYDRLAAGSLVGHILECGAQASGGIFTDWETVPDWAHIGYPLAICSPDGSFEVTKPSDTGGLCSRAVVTEQMLYEIGDPSAYVLPDVTCDFSGVTVTDVGPNRVHVSGAAGRPPSGAYKLSITHRDGWRAFALLPVIGMNAVGKARRQAAAMLERHEEVLAEHGLAPLRATRVEIVGAESSYGRHARVLDSREVLCRIGLEHDESVGIDLFLQEVNAPTTSMAVGSTGWFAGPQEKMPVVRVSSYLVSAQLFPAVVTLGPDRWEVEGPEGVADERHRAGVPQGSRESVPVPNFADDLSDVPLHVLAHGRSGDKGNDYNIGIIARRPEFLEWIRHAVTEQSVAEFFDEDFETGTRPPKVDRHELPGIAAFNFVCRDALAGGQMASLRLDALGKAKAQQLLEMRVAVPRALLDGAELQMPGEFVR